MNIDKLHVFYLTVLQYQADQPTRLQTVISCMLLTMIVLHFIEVMT